MASSCLISCLMPTANRRRFVPLAIECFLAQDWPEKELIIVDDGSDSIADLVPADARVRYHRQQPRRSIGVKRNFGCQQARGDVIAHWDDDDWSARWRLRYQYEQLATAQAELCGLDRVLFYAPFESRAWEYVYPPGGRRWIYGASLCYRRTYWQSHPFPDVGAGEDTRFVWSDPQARIQTHSDPRFLVAVVHDNNTSRKNTRDSRYQPKPVAEVEELLGGDANYYRRLRGVPTVTAPASDPPPRKPAALVSAALGIGDILRVTPLVRVLHRLGHEVDVLLETDYPEVAQLIEGAPEVRRVFSRPSRRCGAGSGRPDDLAVQSYDVATFTTWSAPLRDQVTSRRHLAFDRARWLAEGDSRSVEAIARELGWQGELPAPFAVASSRRFDLPPGTIALHPGCKYEWPWKKWHGFDQLARSLPNVVIVGSAEDLRTDNTYFRKPFAWPEHARDFTGQLSLPDTAALLRECAALVSNDSGLMHLAVALGVPTFGIFGITSPTREGVPAKNFFPISKGLPCEPACRAGAWGRRDCEFHLACLKSLTPEEVAMTVTAQIAPAIPPRQTLRAPNPPPATSPPPTPPAATRETINLTYHGWVFDASGYGHAARAYIHALHQAGVNLSVVDLSGHPPQVADPLVQSLLHRPIEADFHLFHGVPGFWARRAFPLRNVIAMTVWETDTMPSQWRPVLTHALDVWLPCEFNAAVFARDLAKPVFKLPHPLLPMEGSPSPSPGQLTQWGIRDGDQVFYSVFEWQDRKGPRELLEAFLRAFPSATNDVLVVKSGPAAASEASATLAELRARIPSQARIELRCETWSDAQIAQLHSRGDCYVSLHRGEGWNLPLFDAACLGKAIIATNYSGPLEYLDPEAHSLVRARMAGVRQRYQFYHPSMKWGDPDIDHAVELLQGTATHLDAAKARSQAAAERILHAFSLERVGDAARARLLQCLKRTHPEKWERLTSAVLRQDLQPPVPIPGDWYDADYFERGIKSNWRDGYHWRNFSALFRETAAFLTEVFPEAHSFLDAGCARGFLVRSLRERGKDAWGFDHSQWALEHAEESAKPYLFHALADQLVCPADYDALVAMSLFESLTESQALSVLKAARKHIGQVLFAVVTCANSCATGQPTEPNDHDLSHVTLRSRETWEALFQEAGWLQDPLHRVVQRLCQNHAHVRRMNWQVFVCSPAHPSIPRIP